MEFAIIAAGEGSRLREEGFAQPKPMVMLDGLPVIHRLINVFLRNGATGIHIIINDFSPEVKNYLEQLRTCVPQLNVIIKSTPSSLHSFYEILPYIQGDTICLTTVDTVFDETEFSKYIGAFTNPGESADALMAVTSFIDDEKPLYAATDAEWNITAYPDEKGEGIQYVSGGIYCLNRRVFGAVKEAVESAASRMRNLQRLFVSKGFKVKAYPFSKIIDIDHVQDIASAAQWLAETKLAAAQV